MPMKLIVYDFPENRLCMAGCDFAQRLRGTSLDFHWWCTKNYKKTDEHHCALRRIRGELSDSLYSDKQLYQKWLSARTERAEPIAYDQAR